MGFSYHKLPPSSASTRAPPYHNAHATDHQSFLATQPPPHPPVPSNGFYNYEFISRLCARYITHLFDCQDPSVAEELPRSIAYAIYKAQLQPSITFAALFLLTRLKIRCPAKKGASGLRLFLAAFMLANNTCCEQTYSDEDWAIVGQHKFGAAEVEEMEREMRCELQYHLDIPTTMLSSFWEAVTRDFSVPHEAYPIYPSSMVFEKYPAEC